MEASARGVTRGQPFVIRPPSRWISLGLRELWRYRELLYFLAVRDLKVRYKQTFLGAAWAILQPVMYMIVFTLFFGRLADLYDEGKPYALLALAGSVIWLYFANSVTLAAGSLVSNAALVTKVYFPRLLAVGAPIVAGILDLLLACGVLFAVMAGFGQYPAGRIWLAVPFVGLAIATAVGVGAFLAAINVRFRDVRYAVPFLLQLWLFASPVVYSTQLIDDSWKAFYYLNPMAGVVDGFRWSVLGGIPPETEHVLISGVSGLALLVVGVLYFRRMERTFADIV